MRDPRRKLTPDTARALRSEYVPGKVRQVDLATKYGITQSAVNKVLLGHVWRESA